MSSRNKFIVFFCLMLLATAGIAPRGARAQAGPSDEITAALAEALDHYTRTEFNEGLAVAGKLLERDDLTARDTIAVYEVMSIITYAMGEDFKNESFTYLKNIADIGPCLITLPREIWPRELRDRWYRLSKEKDALVCEETAGGDIRTVAVMAFDNYSIGEYREKLGFLSKGLADFFQYDFAQISDLKVIERDKIDFILKEMELQKSGAVDKSTAARVGKILGAQLMVFGSITQIDKNKARMIVRVVRVETSEIIASGEREGKPDFVTMEKELVAELAEKLDIMLTTDIRNMIETGGTSSMDAAELYARGLDYMDKYEYEKAYDYFKMAYDKDNSFFEAKRKMEIYRPLIG